MDFGTAVIETVNNSELKYVKVNTFGYDDKFIKHGSIEEIEKENGLNAENIANNVLVNTI